ncbi:MULTISPECIES: sigma-E processing peptidase SpoIIGA [unclassified Clostridium]|mgnify:FL=1|uniref:sigma-E processing peptidase SpoIIGA n=1 Tax=Clostridium TaxID=1485 RepID=UPI001C8BCA37|nr:MULTISPECIES: sigma-E processing peptidase SpoIIGA [unclassified Clostridium]MBX9135833.1 sigma-E processing peptidase SpoIIGA [Clostridium sp. K12(2020)]MBX9142563.1 sigma-E processing peptidase SpoIIGA [Clostridium sp. K13]MDU2288752.1 sigma-E processing peptidase SpoIIGA [Clostridium celatum]MDU4326068.1 sigma-E processing peptidase SpoIIGA [Clostridium celatum]
MEIYIDIYLLENIIINLFLLLLTFRLLRFDYKKRNVYLAALLGAIYGLVIFCNVKIFSSVGVKILVPAIMIYISMEKRSFKVILKSIVVFFMLAFMLSGICFGTVQMQNTYLIGQEFIIKNNSAKFIVLSVAVIFIVVTRVADLLKDRALVKNFLYDIYITEGARTVLVKGFLDTGNELREPVTNLPCIIVENTYFNQFKIADDKKFIIKYDTINEIGEIKGFKGQNVIIRNEEENTWTKVEAVICGCERKLSKEDEFQALLSRGIV